MQPFICLEGVDATGKTSIGKELAKKIGGEYYKTPGYMTQEERDTLECIDIDPQIRYSLYKNSVIRDSQKIQNLLNTIPVICDRYIFSTVAGHNALGMNLDLTQESNGLLMPDLTILLVATEEKILQRLKQREKTTPIESNVEIMRRNQKDFLSQGHVTLDTTNTTVESATQIILECFLHVFKYQEEFAK